MVTDERLEKTAQTIPPHSFLLFPFPYITERFFFLRDASTKDLRAHGQGQDDQDLDEACGAYESRQPALFHPSGNH